MATRNSLNFLKITVEDIDDNTEIFELLRHVKPGWVLAKLCCKPLDGGLLNGMKMFYQECDASHNDAVVVRVFGDRLGNITPRRTEFLALQIAHAAGCFPTIHASFSNGVVYKYAKGRVPGFEDILKPEVIADITGKMYRLHHIDLKSLTLLDRDGIPAQYDGEMDVFTRVKLFFDKIPSQVEDTDRNDRFQTFRQKFTNDMLLEEYEFVKQVYEEVQLPLVFSHGDLHPRNMALNDENNGVMYVWTWR